MYYERYFTRASHWLDVSVVFSDALVRGSDYFYLEGCLSCVYLYA